MQLNAWPNAIPIVSANIGILEEAGAAFALILDEAYNLIVVTFMVRKTANSRVNEQCWISYENDIIVIKLISKIIVVQEITYYFRYVYRKLSRKYSKIWQTASSWHAMCWFLQNRIGKMGIKLLLHWLEWKSMGSRMYSLFRLDFALLHYLK